MGSKRPASADSVTTTQRPTKTRAAGGASAGLQGSGDDEDDDDNSDGTDTSFCCVFNPYVQLIALMALIWMKFVRISDPIILTASLTKA